MSIFSEAYAEMLGTGETGQVALARFYKDIGTGSIESAKILPIVARIMQERAAPKLDVMKKTSIAEQGRFQNALADLTIAGSKSGVEQGFGNVWRGFTDALAGAQPLVRALAGSFEDFTKLLRPFTRIFTQLNDAFASLAKFSGIAEKNFANLAIIGGLMMTKWGKIGLIFSTIAMILEDISMGINGEGNSFTGQFLKWLDEGGIKLGAFERALFGVSAGLLAISVGMKAMRGLGLLGNLFGVKTPHPGPWAPPTNMAKPTLWGRVKSFALPAAVVGTMYSAYKSYNTSTDEFREKYGLNFGKDSFLGDLGVRTLGTFADLGNTLTGGLARMLGEWLGKAMFEANLSGVFDPIIEAFKQALRSILPEATHAWLGLARPAGPGTSWNVGRQGQSITFAPGSITINAPNADAQGIADELLDIISGQTQNNYNQVLQNSVLAE